MEISRCKRKNRTDIQFKGCGGLTDAFDDAFKEMMRVNDDEFDFIASDASDNDLQSIILSMNPSYNDKKNLIITLEQILSKYKKDWNDNNN